MAKPKVKKCPGCDQKWNGKFCYTQGCKYRITDEDGKRRAIEQANRRELVIKKLRAQIRRLGKKPVA